MAASEGMIAIMTANSGRSPKHVAPFGGREARLGTNPICIAVPADLDAPLVVDMATSAVAAGKVKLAQAKGVQVPEGWIMRGDGKPTTDPFDYGRDGGVLLPLGGPEGHKGYGLSAMVEILSALLPGLGFGVEPTGRHNDGCFLAVFNVQAFRDLATFKKEVADFAHYLKDTPPAEGFNEVLYPGEIELAARRNVSRAVSRWTTRPGRSSWSWATSSASATKSTSKAPEERPYRCPFPQPPTASASRSRRSSGRGACLTNSSRPRPR